MLEKNKLGMCITLANNKGGVGKSFMTVNLAGAIAEADLSCVVIDADDSMNTSNRLALVNSAEHAFPITRLLSDATVDPMTCVIHGTEIRGVSLIKSDLGIKRLVAQKTRGDIKLEREMAATFKAHVEKLRESFDFVLIDMGPSMDATASIVLSAATDLVMVLDSSPNAEDGVVNMLGEGMCKIKSLNPEVKIHGAVYNNLDMRTTISKYLSTRTEIAHGMVPVLPVVFPFRAEVAEALVTRDFLSGKNKKTLLSERFRQLRDILIEGQESSGVKS